jgi:hypothetical protein
MESRKANQQPVSVADKLSTACSVEVCQRASTLDALGDSLHSQELCAQHSVQQYY